jgi:hypothetical protein
MPRRSQWLAAVAPVAMSLGFSDNPASKSLLIAMIRELGWPRPWVEHEPEKWIPVSGTDHAQRES